MSNDLQKQDFFSPFCWGTGLSNMTDHELYTGILSLILENMWTHRTNSSITSYSYGFYSSTISYLYAHFAISIAFITFHTHNKSNVTHMNTHIL